MTVIILPDPTTRECREHPGQFFTKTIPCMFCYAAELIRAALQGSPTETE